MRARMGLHLGGVAFNAYEIVLRAKPPALREASPKATVPVLVLSSQRVIEQSWDIVCWALTQPATPLPARRWWEGAGSPENQALLACNDTLFKHHLDRYKYPERFNHATGPQNDTQTATDQGSLRTQHLDTALSRFLAPLERRLRDAQFLGGGSPCATDIGIFPFVRQFAAVDPKTFAILPLPHVRIWLDYWLQSSLFQAIMVKWPADTVHHFDYANGLN
jgi:glutathione S-transferase